MTERLSQYDTFAENGKHHAEIHSPLLYIALAMPEMECFVLLSQQERPEFEEKICTNRDKINWSCLVSRREEDKNTTS